MQKLLLLCSQKGIWEDSHFRTLLWRKTLSCVPYQGKAPQKVVIGQQEPLKNITHSPPQRQ